MLIFTKHPTAKTNMTTFYKYFLRVNFRTHLFFSVVLRLALIYYSQLHDEHSEVPYSDIDYRVVTDGSRYILAGLSPFERHTYRYSPLLAYLQMPNVLIHPAVGKIIYASFDIFVALLIYALVYNELQSQCRKAVTSLLLKFRKKRRSGFTKQTYNESDEYNLPEKIARVSACFWLYNPLTAVISTRGNGDGFSSFFVTLTIYLISKSESASHGRRNWFIFSAGLAHGFAIHLRLYPILFSLTYYLCLSTSLTRCMRDFLQQLLFPSAQQILLVLGTIFSLCVLVGFFYRFYGGKYLYEAYFYHFLRKDVRHNFSIYFLMQYLGCGNFTSHSSLVVKLLIIAPQLFLLIHLSFSFGQFRQTMPFCVFLLAFVIVTFNSVVTSQYFVWYLSLLPLCLNNLQSLSVQKPLFYLVIWLLSQVLWLLPAYLLEFKAWNTFYWIGGQGVLFFLVNNFLLARFIQYYNFTSFKVNSKHFF